MILGQYTLTVTCTVCGMLDKGYSSLTVYTGKDATQATEKCLNAGWTIDMQKGAQVCPECAKAEAQ